MLLAGLLACAALAERPVPDVVTYNRDVRPILSNTCFKCHGPDAVNNQSDLRLDDFDLATQTRTTADGRSWAAIVPGSVEESEIWARILSDDPTKVMPPPDSLHQLSERDRAVLRKWIEQGAEYEPHWSYIRVKAVTPPELPTTDRVRNPIDQFVQRALADEGFAPSPDADRRTLARRVALDITGLPPEPADLEAHLADDRPDAYERWVEQLLASPHYGERMTVPWLDVVRFSDTVGFHGDQRQNIFPYRDYVIDAFNSDKPYDEFIREQLAGDLMPDPTTEQLVATGFNRLNLMTREGGAQPGEYLAKYAADRVRAVSTAFMGSTVGCAECHDHKYDPFTTKDFYSLAAYFADLRQWGVYNDYDYTPNPDLKGFNNDFPFPPEIEVPSRYRQEQLRRLQEHWKSAEEEAIAAILAAPDELTAAADWGRRNQEYWQTDDGWQVLQPGSMELGENTEAEVLDDRSVRFTSIDPSKPWWRNKDVSEISFELPPGDIATFKLEAIPDDQAEGGVARKEFGVFNIVLQVARQSAGEEEPQKIVTNGAYPDRDTWTYENAYLMTSLDRYWRSRPQDKHEQQETVWQLQEPFTVEEGDRLIFKVQSESVARLRFSVSPLGLRRGGESLAEGVLDDLRLAAAGDESSPDERDALVSAYLRGGRAGDANFYPDRLEDLRGIVSMREGNAFTMVSESQDPLVTRVLPRGNWQDESGEVVQPAVPEFLAMDVTTAADQPSRLDLADWIASAENPLTSRTLVNRLWQQFFGTGLSFAVDDLGLQGEYPSHPELLDWLADEFVDSGWSVKHMVRLIVTSTTYRQSSRRREDLNLIDPDNRLLSYFPPKRLEAEFVRDQALAAAQLLNRDIGGPSAHPYQPANYYESLNFPERKYQADAGALQYRRGVYTHWQRTFLHPMMANFDAPSREECTAERTVSNTPQQALTLLNDPSFVEAARALAENTLRRHATDGFSDQLDFAYQRVLSRSPASAEEDALAALWREQHTVYSKAPDDAEALVSVGNLPFDSSLSAVDVAAWTQVARVILNLNEAIVRY